MSKETVAGLDPGQRRLNGPQTSGRNYRNLSQPEYTMLSDDDVAVPMRDGIRLLADIRRPHASGRFPALIAVSPYPRQIQNLGAPIGFIEAGASDFFVPRGYVHVMANNRGTGGSGGTFGFFDGQERRDMYDLVEWTAAQPWCDGNVGMIGISYFAGTQMEAAVERPPHLKAIMPIAGTFDLYESAYHHGLFSSSFVTPFISMIGMTSGHTNKLWRSKLLDIVGAILHEPHIHRKFATMNGEAAMTGLKVLLKLRHEPHPWDDLWRQMAVEHPFRDAFWEDRNIVPLLDRVEVPVYLGCDWQNVPLHLPHTFIAFKRLTKSRHVQLVMLGDYGLTWPWESLHVEALAWNDHWLKGKDTGILDGPAVRYVLPGAEGWHTATSWPVPNTTHQEYVLRADGVLSTEGGAPGVRSLMALGSGLVRTRRSEVDPPNSLTWETKPLEAAVNVIGHMELRLDATTTAPDTAWIALLEDVDQNGTAKLVTQGYLRAGLRRVDVGESATGDPVLPCDTYEAVPAGERVAYRIPMVANARRFEVGHRIRLSLTSDDQDAAWTPMMTFRHAPVGTSSVNTIASSSRLVLPIVVAGDSGKSEAPACGCSAG